MQNKLITLGVLTLGLFLVFSVLASAQADVYARVNLGSNRTEDTNRSDDSGGLRAWAAVFFRGDNSSRGACVSEASRVQSNCYTAKADARAQCMTNAKASASAGWGFNAWVSAWLGCRAEYKVEVESCRATYRQSVSVCA